MRRGWIIVVGCLWLVSCRQPDGTITPLEGERANKAEDVGRDLKNVSESRNGALQELREDLANLSGATPPAHLIDELSTRLNAALADRRLSDEASQALARHLVVASTARDLSGRQRTVLRQDVTSALTAAGVPAQNAEPVAEVTDQIQDAITTNRRRWWHLR